MSIGDILAEQARTRPEAVAIIDDSAGSRCRLTFAGLEEEVSRASGWLHHLGLRRGQAVLVFVPMSADLYVAMLAMFRLGVVALFLDPSAGREHIERCCARQPPNAFLAIRKAHWLRLISPALRRIPVKIAVGGWLPGTHRWPERFESPPAAATAVLPEEAALVTFTSGSTGVPKATVRTHEFLLAQHRALAPAIALEPGEVDLATLPVFTLANLASGLTTVIPNADMRRPGAVDAVRLFAQMERTGTTRITASPAFFERLVEHGLKTGTTLTNLRKLYTGGAPVFPRLLEAIKKLAPHAEVVAVYGSTEAEPIAHIAQGEISENDMAAMRAGRGLLTGRTVPEIRLRILIDRSGSPRPNLKRDEFDREAVPVGSAGEIVVTGEHVLKGYLGGVGDEETKFQVDSEVWHRTGDAGWIDDQGRLWLLGRCAARISDTRGELYPFTVECVAMTVPLVRRAAVLTHQDRRLLVVESTAATPDLAIRLSTAMAWAQIDDVRFVDALPVDKRHNAKIDYPALRRMLEE